MILSVSTALLTLALAAFLLALIGHGWANTIDRIALTLHRHAERVRRMHGARERAIRGMWQDEQQYLEPQPYRKSLNMYEK